MVTSPTRPTPDLAGAFVDFLRRTRAQATTQWVYHPRDNQLGDFVRREFASDLLTVSKAFATDCRAGRIACDLGFTMAAGGRSKKMDIIIGRPSSPTLPNVDDGGALRRVPIQMPPAMTVETKSCMTAHRQATPRLIDELLSSLDVVRAVDPATIALAVVVVNVSPQFTSPLKLPGPNKHKQPQAASRVIQSVISRVVEGPARPYDALCFIAVDFDNENRIEAVDQRRFVGETFSYSALLERAAKRYDEFTASWQR